MTDLDEKVKKTWEDVEKLKSQIANILQSLIANKDLFESGFDVTPSPSSKIHDDPMTGQASSKLPPPPPPISKPSNLLSKLSRKNKLIPSRPQPSNGTGNGSVRGDSSCRVSSTAGTGSVAALASQQRVEDKRLQLWLPTYGYLESETFLLPLLDRWVWGTTITNNSKIAALFPELTLSIVEPCPSPSSPFSYFCTIALVDSEWKAPARTIPTVSDLPFQQSFGLNENQLNRIQPGCRATITVTFETPVISWTIDNRFDILANLSLNGKFQCAQGINLQLSNLAVFKDDIYKRFQPQIFRAMSQCQTTFRLERRLTHGHPSLSTALRHFLGSLGFQIIHSVRTETHVTLDSYGCDIPAMLFGSTIGIEENAGDHTTNSLRCSLSTRSEAQLQSLLSLLSVWMQKDLGGRNSLKGIRISSLSTPSATVEEKRLTLLAEIEILIHLLVLENRNALDYDLVVYNWIGAFSRAVEASDEAFRS